MSRYFPVILMVVGLLLRVAGLTDRSLWLDEYTSLEVATKSIHDILFGIGFDSHTPPFYYLLLHGWLLVAPFSEAGLRLFSLLIDLVNIALVLHVFGKQFGRLIGLWSGAVYVLSAYSVYYAQEGRMYTLASCLVLATYLLALRFREGELRPIGFVLLFLTAVAGMYTHYYYALALFGMTVGLIISLRKEPRRLASWIGTMVLVGIAFLPWLGVIRGLIEGEGQAFRQFVFPVIPYTLFRFAAGYANLAMYYGAKEDYIATTLAHLPVIAAYLGAFVVVLFPAWIAVKRKGKHGALFLSSLVVPPVAALLLSLVSPMLSERYLIVIFPFFACLVAWALSGNAAGRLTPYFRVTILSLMIAALFRHYTSPDFKNTDWRGAAKTIESFDSKSRIVFVSPDHVTGVFGYYLSDEFELVAVPVDKKGWKPRLKFMSMEERQNGVWLVERGTSPPLGEQFKNLGWEARREFHIPYENGIRLSFFKPVKTSPW